MIRQPSHKKSVLRSFAKQSSGVQRQGRLHRRAWMNASGLFAGLFLLLLWGGVTLYRHPQRVYLHGITMGMGYTVTAYGPRGMARHRVEKSVLDTFATVDRTLSTYRADSELSKWNASRSFDLIHVSSVLFDILTLSQQLYVVSEGAWDGTAKPLFEAWGFSGLGMVKHVPTSQNIQLALAHVGFYRLNLISPNLVQKRDSLVSVSLESVAPGYAVDLVAKQLEHLGYLNYSVEVGGQVKVKGKQVNGKLWRVEMGEGTFFELTDKAIATSGKDRSFVSNGKRYSHVLNPRTGFPIVNGMSHVTVLADSCALACGLNTALMVLGPQEGQILLKRFPHTRAVFTLN